MRLSNPIEFYNTVNPNVNYGYELVVKYQYWFINYDKHTTPMQDQKGKL